MLIRKWEAKAYANEFYAVVFRGKLRVILDNGASVSKSDVGMEFHINDGHIRPAISHAVKTMRKGEKAELSVKFPCDKKVLKKIIEAGEGFDRPNEGATVKGNLI
ncbi:FKBP-type peptidyl-prolyl cis-trans isomerase domain [Dillenia turbinata]|uniref:Rotamase n=1 Tax=Dillenia turbinata TaxID=194707 RepID=A0AAN8WDD8_9MAGN